MSAEVQDLAVRYGAAWAGRDLDAIMAMHTDDTVFHLHGGGEPAIGRGATWEAFAAALAAWPICASTGSGCTSEQSTS